MLLGWDGRGGPARAERGELARASPAPAAVRIKFRREGNEKAFRRLLPWQRMAVEADARTFFRSFVASLDLSLAGTCRARRLLGA